jgi:glycosyltransferase involved in cell wall biosynthesis
MNSPPRVLHIAGGTEFGGGSLLILEIARATQAAGFEVSVLTTDPTFQAKLTEAGVPFEALDVIRRPIRPLWDLRGLIRLTRFLRSSRPDIVHTHTSKSGFIGRLAAHRAGVPVVMHTVHGFAFHEFSARRTELVYVALERRAARWCDRIITVSEHHRRVALDRGIGTPDQVIAIPNGLAPDRCLPRNPPTAIRAALGVGDSDFLLLGVGRLAEQKGFGYLLEALADLRDPAVRLILAGTGPLEERLRRRAEELGLSERVRLLGFRDDIGDLLAACDLVTLPSLYEGLSIALLEAMAAARPVLTTAIPSNIEVTKNGEGAYLVAAHDAAALRDGIAALKVDPGLRAELARRGKAIFDADYTQDRMLAAYLAEYRSLLESKRSGPR